MNLTGQSSTPMGKNGPVNLIAVDWAGPRGCWYTFDGENVGHVSNLLGLFDLSEFCKPHTILMEAGFESFETHNRDRFIIAARKNGHDIQWINGRMTAHTRCAEQIEKSDESDTLVIWKMYASGKHFSPALLTTDTTDTWRERHQALNREAMKLRNTGGKPEMLKHIECLLGPAKDLPENIRLACTDSAGRKYSAGMTSVYLAAREANNRQEFERFLGLYQNGYPCLLRSDVFHWMWRFVNKRGIISFSEFRKAIRQCYYLFNRANLNQ